jgi:hypothetical protein
MNSQPLQSHASGRQGRRVIVGVLRPLFESFYFLLGSRLFGGNMGTNDR